MAPSGASLSRAVATLPLRAACLGSTWACRDLSGMMDTVLNLGLNDQSVEGLAKQTDDERFAYDSYRRFVAMYGRIVLGIPGEEFDNLLEAAKELAGTTSDAGVPTELLRYLVDAYQQIVERHTGKPFPQNPDDQDRKSTR